MAIENKNAEVIEIEQKKKVKIGMGIAALVCLLYVLIGALIMAQESTMLPLIMGAIIFPFGPLTAIFYLRDVKRGVFKPTKEEEEEYRKMMEESLEERDAQR